MHVEQYLVIEEGKLCALKLLIFKSRQSYTMPLNSWSRFYIVMHNITGSKFVKKNNDDGQSGNAQIDIY